MNKIAPWILPAAGVVLLVSSIIVLASVGGDTASVDGAALREEIESTRRDLAALKEASDKLSTKVASLEGKLDEVRKALKGARLSAAEGTPGIFGATPPPGHVVGPFDRDLQDWAVPAWGSGTVRHTTRPGMFRRGNGGLALGYAYGEAPPAAKGSVRPNGRVRAVRLYARTRVREIVLAVGVEEESGARYEVRVPPLRPREGWRLVSVEPAAMGIARGTTDPDRKLDLAKIRAIYVADRTRDAVGGNVLLIDDVAVELMP